MPRAVIMPTASSDASQAVLSVIDRVFTPKSEMSPLSGNVAPVTRCTNVSAATASRPEIAMTSPA